MAKDEFLTSLSVQVSDSIFHTVMDTGFFGRFKITPEVHTHPYYELQATIDGVYSIEFLDREPIRMEKDMLCLIPPSQYHSTHAISENPQKLALRYSYEPNRNTPSISALYRSFHAAFSAITEPMTFRSAELCELILQIHREQVSPKLGAEEMTRLYIGQFYIWLLRLLNFCVYDKAVKKTTERDSDTSRYSRIEKYFGDHFAEPITEEDLARDLELSTRQTSRLLRTIYGMSFREKLTSIRMTNAAKLLSKTELPIKKIAVMVGYESTAGFFLAFKKYFGMSGTEYRRKTGGEREGNHFFI